MDGAGFDPNRWNHWLLISCFVGMSILGLQLPWQWGKESRSKLKARRERARLARRLSVELHGVGRSSLENRRSPLTSIYEKQAAGRSVRSRSE